VRVSYTPQLGAEICARLAEGRSLRSVCRQDGMPNMATVFRWLANDEEFAKTYAIAMGERADAIFEEMFEIADDARNDFLEETQLVEGVEVPSGVYKFRKEHVQRSRLRIETRKWALARMNPKKYGDKMTAELTGPNGGAVVVELVRFSDEKKGGGDGGASPPPA
jgi:hypothetical protein